MFVSRADSLASSPVADAWGLPGSGDRIALAGRTTPSPIREAMPHPRLLVALGTVLCVHRPALGEALQGWRRACRVALHQRLDSDGLDECLWFFDAQGLCCWRLYLLPDSDFLAWDALLEGLPVLDAPPGEGLAERMWRRLAGRLRGESWRATALRLQLRGPLGGGLGAIATPVSEAGRMTAERLARIHGG